MKLLVVVTYFTVLVVQECNSYFYPPVIWHSQNCVFRKLKESYGTNVTKEYFMKVVPRNGVNIVCPNEMTVNDWLGSQLPERLYENMWLVDKHGYDNCMVNEKGDPKFNKRILLCDDPKKIKYKTFQLHNRFNTEEPMFAPGYHYYFISTSRGDKKRLDNKSGGHCKNTFMKLHIYVCDPKKEDCVWEMPKCDPPYNMMKLMRDYSFSLPPPTRAPVTIAKPIIIETSVKPTAAPTQVRSESKDILTKGFDRHRDVPLPTEECKDKKEEGTSIHMVLNFVLGGVILFMAIVIVILACGLARSGDKGRPTSVAFSAIAQEPSSHLYEETARFIHPPLTPLSKSPPQTPITMNPPFYLTPMSEIRPRSPSSNKYCFNNSVYQQRRHSYDATSNIEVEPMITDTAAAV